MLLGVFLILGFVIRELIKPLQKLYIPSSVVGGLLALICGEQVLGLITLPNSFSQIPGVLINLIMTSLLFGVTMNLKRARNYIDYSLLMIFTYGLQIFVGVILGNILSNFWPDLPYSWGLMGVFTFWGGHGTAGAVGSIFAENGVPDNLGMGMILATIGLMVAIGIGMIIVNWGIRKGYTPHLKTSTSGEQQLCGVIPKEKQRSLGSETVYSGAINGAALQLGLLLGSLFLGNKIITGLASFIPALKSIPMMVHGMLGSIIVWTFMVKTKMDGYADKRAVETISGLCLELVVFAAIATLRLDLVTDFFMPILIFSTVFTVMMVVVVLLFAKNMCKDDWFEKAMLHFGQGTGAMPTGLALLRCVDPELKSTAAESVSMANTITLPITAIIPALLPIMIMTSPGGVIAIGIGLTAACLILGFIFCYKK
jgi:ESS family glutamate:Na+ symporter